MATLKGTWRFNDVLDYPQGYVSGIFRFTTFPNGIIDNNSKTITAIDGSVTWNRLDCREDGTMLFISMEAPDFISAGWLRVNTTPSWGNVYLEMGGAVSADQTFVDGLKTITILDDTEVSDEFYAWFTANAKPILSGKWKFNDALTAFGKVNVDSPPFPTTTAIKIAFTSNDTEYASMAFASVASDSIINPLYFNTAERSGFDFTDITQVETAVKVYDVDSGWENGDAYKTIVFNGEQLIDDSRSVMFYDWFTANAVEVIGEETDDKINISFNNKIYFIDASSLSFASSALASNLSTVMNGTGAKIELNGVFYNIDFAKLADATSDFISRLGAIAGSDSKIVVGGTEYGIDTGKVADAIAELETVLNNLMKGE